MEQVAAPSKVLSYLRLFRLPNVFTAFADVAMGYCFIQGKLRLDGSLIALLLASGLLYTSGMVLNDVFDIEVDREERPKRPLPSGAIDLAWARKLGFTLLFIGVLLAWASSWLSWPSPVRALPWRSGLIGTLLACCVVLYDAVAKKTSFGPMVMGSCRFFNVLLGMSVAIDPIATESGAIIGFSGAQLVVALGIAVYIMGVTIFARSEATESQFSTLSLGVFIMAAGLAALALFPRAGGVRVMAIAQWQWWPVVVAMLGLFILRPAFRTLMNPKPHKVQATIKHLIVSLITLDALLTFAMAGMVPSLCVLALLAPMLLLGRWVYST